MIHMVRINILTSSGLTQRAHRCAFIVTSSSTEIANSIKEDVTIWNKGRSGAELTDDEALIFTILVNQVNNSSFYSYMQRGEIAGVVLAKTLIIVKLHGKLIIAAKRTHAWLRFRNTTTRLCFSYWPPPKDKSSTPFSSSYCSQRLTSSSSF